MGLGIQLNEAQVLVQSAKADKTDTKGLTIEEFQDLIFS